jgi:probable rRNA maturation factor
MPAVGDIYICPDVARANARKNKVSTGEELARLVVHGALHVAGHDHPDDESRMKSKMWKRQERILASVY